MNRQHNEPKKSKSSLHKAEKKIESSSKNDSTLYTFPIGKCVIDIPESYTGIIKPFVEKGSLPSLNVSRVWLEKKRTEYFLHIGDLGEVPFD